jgi:hypothetical protein
MVIVVSVVPIALRWLSQGSSAAGASGKLTYGSRQRAFAVVLLLVPLLFVGALAVAKPPKNPTEVLTIAGIFAFFAAIDLPLLIEFYRVTISFDDVGIHVSSPWSRRRTLPWREVRSVRWRNMAKWLDLRTERSVVHISPWLVGLEAFAAACQAHLPADLVSRDAEAASVLALMQQGRGGELVWANESPTSLLQNRPR